VSDFDEVFRVNKEIREDPNRPYFTGTFDLQDEISCELALFEADQMVDSYLEKFRTRFKDPKMFEDLCQVYRKKFRTNLREFQRQSREIIDQYGYHKEDEDGNV